MKYTAVILRSTFEDCTVEIEADNVDDADNKFSDIRRALNDNCHEAEYLTPELLKEKVEWCNAEWQLVEDVFEVVDFSEGAMP